MHIEIQESTLINLTIRDDQTSSIIDTDIMFNIICSSLTQKLHYNITCSLNTVEIDPKNHDNQFRLHSLLVQQLELAATLNVNKNVNN